MCGRFARSVPVGKIAETFGATAAQDIPASWNCAPGQEIALILSNGASCVIRRNFWGVMPAWGRGRLKQPLVNIRSETLREKRTFDKFLSEGRCLIPADGFYEWKTEGKRKRPVFVRLPGGALFYMAGIRENESEKRGCAIITAPSGEKLASLHHRMPLILDREESLLWLDGDTDRLLAQVREPAELQMWPVSFFVNDPGHDSPLCAVPLRPVT